LRISIFFVLIIISVIARADDDKLKPLSSVSLMLSSDADQNRTSFVSLDHYTTSKLRLTAGLGRTRSLSDESFVDDDVGTVILAVGYLWSERFESGFEYKYQGKADSIWTNEFTVPVIFKLENWDFNLGLGRRRIDINHEGVNIRIGKQLSASVFQVGVTYFGWDPFWTRIGFESTKYDEELAFTDNQILVDGLNSTFVTLSSSLVNNSSYLEFGYDWNRFGLGLDFSQSRSRLDDSQTKSVAISGDYQINRRFSLGAFVGASRILVEDVSTAEESNLDLGFAGVTLSFAFGG